MVLASVPEIDAGSGRLFDRGRGRLAGGVFALEYAAAALERRRPCAVSRDRRSARALGLCEFRPRHHRPARRHAVERRRSYGGDRTMLVLFGMLPFFKLVRYSPALRSLLAAATRRAAHAVRMPGDPDRRSADRSRRCMYAVEHDVQPDKFGTIPQAMWWAIVTLGTVGYGDVDSGDPDRQDRRRASPSSSGCCHDRAAGRIISTAFADEVRRRDFVVTWGMLARVPLFSHLRATEIADIMRLLRAQTIERGESLVRRGEPASSMYFIAAGEVEIELPSAEACGSPTALSSARSRCCSEPSAAAPSPHCAGRTCWRSTRRIFMR